MVKAKKNGIGKFNARNIKIDLGPRPKKIYKVKREYVTTWVKYPRKDDVILEEKEV